ncbi:ribosomal RNA processing protein 1 homolog A-like isoform X1 [Myotis lucifugus]|uniref:ribosomal RNA processing protein 1 homolog A-like isoform X1 n=1 Tax=Myotis lucifugus TaxID=59463 RepID=UPI000CCC00F1|nr:ribosomal RNA processing protein 1 homolog A-like isoform X1 [Myotis lucifugus]
MVPRVQLSPEIQLAQRLAGNAQEELGRTISQLVHAFQTTEAQHLFLQTFWQTMSREWTGIDRLRLDKFYMLSSDWLRVMWTPHAWQTLKCGPGRELRRERGWTRRQRAEEQGGARLCTFTKYRFIRRGSSM